MDSTSKNSFFHPVSSEVCLSKQEENILNFWDENQIFEKTLNQKNRPSYHFYDGPPFATGLPHYGHLLTGILKDIVPRYWSMKGYHVPRRFGWDCHGLPVEYEINKALKLEDRKSILKLGVQHYNQACRNIVKRYSEEWKQTIRRIGRWVDMENPYFTMDLSFMQSVWWVFQQLYKKGLIYEGFKVMPYSIGISTTLSNFEANLNYKDVQDPAITITFPVIENDENFELLAWTTTPWTLPSHLALAVGKDILYSKVKDLQSHRTYVLAEARIEFIFNTGSIKKISTFYGEKLVGLKYQPPFDFFKDHPSAFRVITSDHVTTESGTGIVHLAPAFGEDDAHACQLANITLVNPVDDDGRFTSEVKPWEGIRVKEADNSIIAFLKQKGRIIKHETITHSYPYCYRSDTPLIYRAVSSWFIAVEKFKDQLIDNNKKINWIPEHLKEGRFGHWLENARDWAISRNRFWGTPLPLWRNPEGEIICIGSIEELKRLTQKEIKDLHTDHLDTLTIASSHGNSPLKRVPEVLDCWFESGCMPYAQWGYPFQNNHQLPKIFPADFIAEGLDQTRGWFYTLLVISTALLDQPPFKNVVVNGLVLAEDGRKMSKSLRNYPDPHDILNTYGADALRLYLINSPVVKSQELKFSENAVREVARKILIRWWNAYCFFINYANIDQFYPKQDAESSPNLLDQWILSQIHLLIQTTRTEMDAYRLYNVVPQLLSFIESLTNTYIRFNRRHFWQEGMPEDKRYAYETLYYVLKTLSKIMAPFTPFLSETTYKNLSSVFNCSPLSVHLESFPIANNSLIQPELQKAVSILEALVTLGRNFREQISVKAKIPLNHLKVIHRNPQILEWMKRFEPYFKEELNVKAVTYDSQEDHYIEIQIKPNFPILGKRLGTKMKQVIQAFITLSTSERLSLEQGQDIFIQDEKITPADVDLKKISRPGFPNLSIHALIAIEIDPTVNEEQKQEGLAREIIRKVQASRKKANLNLDDRIELQIQAPEKFLKAIQTYQALVCQDTLTIKLILTNQPQGQYIESLEIEEEKIKLGITVRNSSKNE